MAVWPVPFAALDCVSISFAAFAAFAAVGVGGGGRILGAFFIAFTSSPSVIEPLPLSSHSRKSPLMSALRACDGEEACTGCGRDEDEMRTRWGGMHRIADEIKG